MTTRQGALAAAAASLFATALGSLALAPPAAAAENEIKCEGVNQCKGTSACKTLFSACAGQNSCKGKGFLMLTPAECEKAKAAAADAAKKADE
jgi:hypothetical protein